MGTCFRNHADEVMLKHCSHRTAPDLLFSVDGALGAKGALAISCSPVSQFHQTLLDGLEGMGGGEPYSQQVEEAEVTGESLHCTTAPPWRKERPLTLGRKMLRSAKNGCSVFRGSLQ